MKTSMLNFFRNVFKKTPGRTLESIVADRYGRMTQVYSRLLGRNYITRTYGPPLLNARRLKAALRSQVASDMKYQPQCASMSRKRYLDVYLPLEGK